MILWFLHTLALAAPGIFLTFIAIRSRRARRRALITVRRIDVA